MSDKKSKPSEADKEAAAKLKALWVSASRQPSQGTMAKRWGERMGGGNQSLMSQYINGLIPLNYRALVFFADQLGVSPAEIRNDLPEQRMHVAESTASYDPSLANEINQLPPEKRQEFESLMRRHLELLRGDRGAEPPPKDTGSFRLVKRTNHGRDGEKKREKK